MANFSERLRLLRNEKRYTQNEMAEIFGVKPRTYQDYEYEKVYPTVPGLVRIAEYFDVSLDYLIGRTDKREINR